MILRIVLAATTLFATMLCAAPLAEHAREYRTQLTEKILPYWLNTLDATNGGFLLSDDAVKGKSTPREKQLVSQARILWTFSHAHLHGFDKDGACLKAAEIGYRFLTEKFFDRENGGYFWKTDLAGKPTNERKILYGESFAIYAFVEYHRAAKSDEPLRRAMELYRLIQLRAHDAKNRGWTEHFTRDWKPLAPGDPSGEVEVVGYKSANTHLHFQEALAELYEATHDPEVKTSLEEALDLNKRYFYPKDAGRSCFHRKPDWSEVTDPKSAGLSYGHNVEFAWLMIRAENILGRAGDWPHFYAHIDHALKYGYDHQRGGLFHRGADDQPATDQNKIWWVEAEMMAALTDALQHQENSDERKALDQLIHFVNEYQADKRDGVWLDTVTAEGKPKSTGKAHSWKANYHDVRALLKFVEAFGNDEVADGIYRIPRVSGSKLVVRFVHPISGKTITTPVEAFGDFRPERVSIFNAGTDYFVEIIGQAMTTNWSEEQLIMVANHQPYFELRKTGQVVAKSETPIGPTATISLRLANRREAEGVASALRKRFSVP